MNLEKYEKSFADAREKYHEIMQGKDDAAILIKWMVENDVEPYSVFHENGYAHQTNNLEGLIGLYHTLHHALYDDGDITFVKNNYYPVIVFYWKGENNFQEHYDSHVSRTYERMFKIQGYLDTVQEYMKEYERVHAEWIARLTAHEERMKRND